MCACTHLLSIAGAQATRFAWHDFPHPLQTAICLVTLCWTAARFCIADGIKAIVVTPLLRQRCVVAARLWSILHHLEYIDPDVCMPAQVLPHPIFVPTSHALPFAVCYIITRL